jgi:large subunit ribosomal protein L13
MNEQIVVDAKDAVVGRVASFAAKQALFGKKVIVVNCNEALLSGRRNMVLEQYSHMRSRGRGAQKGPIIPRVAEKLMKRTIRGMLEYTQKRGEEALDRVRCYNALPKEFEAAKKISLAKEMKIRTITLAEVAKII